jgi:hypothetical protein
MEIPIPILQKWDTCDSKTVDESRRFLRCHWQVRMICNGKRKWQLVH